MRNSLIPNIYDRTQPVPGLTPWTIRFCEQDNFIFNARPQLWQCLNASLEYVAEEFVPTREHLLCIAILNTAIMDLEGKFSLGGGHAAKVITNDAKRWFKSDKHVSTHLSFIFIASHLNVSAPLFREELVKLKLL